MKSLYITATFCLLLTFSNAEAQIIGSGVPRTCGEEQYMITSPRNFSWSITNGTIIDSGSSGSSRWCMVIWGSSPGSGQIKYGITTKNVTIQTSIVYPGSINGAKTICYGVSAGTLGSSSNASGGSGIFSYQWQVSSNNSNWSNISGATSNTYAPGNLTSTKYYRRRVISCGQTKYTLSQKITVYGALSAGSISNDQTVCYSGNPSALTNVASASGGATLTYQWQQSTTSSSSGFANISGATGSTYDPPTLTQSTWYRRRVTSSSGCGTKYTNVIKITVRANLSAGSIGNTQTVCHNGNPSALTNTSSASGGATRTYQWQHSTTSSSSGFANISGATGSTYDPPALTQSTWYRRRVTSSSGCGTKYTNVIKITVRANLSAGSIGNAQTICYNDNPSALTNTSSASGGATRTYLWQHSTTSSSSGFANISGATGSTYDPPALTQNTWYRRAVTSSSGCGTKYTNVIQVTVRANLSAGSIGNTQTVCYNGNPSALTNTSSASGGATRTYQWQHSTTSSTSGFANISGATGSTYDPPTLTQNTWYRRAVTSSSGCGTEYSNIIQVAVRNDLTPGSIGEAQLICMNEDPVELSNVSSATGGTAITYQWQRSTVNASSGFGDISGASSATYDPDVLTQTTWFRRAAISGSSCGTVFTSAIEIVVYEPLTAGVISGDQQVCVGSLPSALTGTTPTGGGSYSYQWEVSTDEMNWNPLLDGTSATYGFSTFGQSSSYRRVVSNECESQISNLVHVEIKALPTPGNIGSDIQICMEDVAESMTGTITDPDLTYQWQSSVDGQLWDDISGATNPAYTPGSVTKYYRRGVIEDGCIGYSNAKRVEAIQCSPDAGLDQMALNDDSPLDLGGVPSGGTWTGRGVEENVFYPEVAGVGEHELTYTYSSGPGGERNDKMITKVEFNSITPTFLSNYAFEYRYDSRQRMVMKQVPGADSVLMIYDKRDRLVMTQDGNQRAAGQWTFTKYDQLNRPVMTGIIADGRSRTDIQDEVNLLEDAEFYESYTGTGDLMGYDGTGYPATAAEADMLTVTYYDNYGFTADSHWTLGDYSTENQAKTYVTGGKVRVDLPGDTYDWNETITLYDSRYRMASTISQDYQGNKDTFVNEYYSLVHPLVVKTIHTHESAITAETTEITKDFDFDHADRLMKVTQTLDVISDPSFMPVTKVILENKYNELGELITKKLNKQDDGNFSQEVDYEYNIRGWLTKINDPETPDPSDYFSMQLQYDDATNAQYNGNIGATVWKNPFETTDNQYDYTYDPVNRLKSATYNSEAFSVPNIDYDANGNILALQRKGMTDTGTVTDWDDLDYSYVGNQLTKVEDAGDNDLGFKDGANTSTEYEYDANGNMISDANKGIDSIYYNHLNLPVKVEMAAEGDSIIYIYDAAGTKLAQIVYEGGNQTKRTDYQGAFIYENGTLQFIQHEEGRIVYETDVNGDFVEYGYQYHLKDHLGNVRATFKEEGDMDQSLASFEPAVQANESNYFTGYDGMVKITADLFNHTSGGNTSIRLNGSTNEREGLGKSLKVKPGDVIDMEVYAKYFLQSESAGWTETLNTLASNIASNAGGIVIDGGGIGADANPFVDWSGKSNPTSAPEAYLNYMVFDEYFNLISEQTGYQQISEAAKENGSDIAHEKLEHSITITQSGYIYIYLSNEEDTPIDVFFDDFTVTQNHTPIVSKDDYYPFGLTFASYNRPASTDQKWKFQGQEHVDALGVNWDSFKWRNHQPDLGRFFNVDPLADKFYHNSPYAFSENKVVSHVELEGLEGADFRSRQAIAHSLSKSNGQSPAVTYKALQKAEMSSTANAIDNALTTAPVVAGILLLNPVALTLGIPVIGIKAGKELAPDNQIVQDTPDGVGGTIGRMGDVMFEQATGLETDMGEKAGGLAESLVSGKDVLKLKINKDNPLETFQDLQGIISSAIDFISTGLQEINGSAETQEVKATDQENIEDERDE